MLCCYILYSATLNRHYIGICQSDLQERIVKHNTHAYGDHRYTAKASDWRLLVCIETTTISQARKIELHIKRMKSSVYIQNLIKYPEMIDKLKMQYAVYLPALARASVTAGGEHQTPPIAFELASS
jgi:putative endonuclease